MVSIGILAALGALLSWAFGDFFIQRTTRLIGNIKALFYIGVCSSVVLFPFIYKEFGTISHENNPLILLFVTAIVCFLSAIFVFEGLKEGKIAIIEPIFSTELIITVLLSIFFLHERPTPITYLLITLVFVGIFLTIYRKEKHLFSFRSKLEKGVVYGIIGALSMGTLNFLVGGASKTIDPLFVMWYTHTLLAVLCFPFIVHRGEVKSLITDLKRFPGVISLQSILDTMGWVFFAVACSKIPVTIATTISESYVIITALLGFTFNKEKATSSQKAGIVITFISVMVLSYITA